jgi:sRNA-binding carbon storage regulator CsrA
MSSDLGMLVLTMRPKERVVLRDQAGKLLASLTVVRTVNGRMRLGVAAPQDVVIGRENRDADLRAVVSEERVRNSYKKVTA